MTSETGRDWTTGVPVVLLSACARCGNTWYLPHSRCPVCGSIDVSRAAARGVGLCVAVTVLHVTTDGEPGPVRLGLIELDEGPLVMGRVHDEGLAPGERARIDFGSGGHVQALVPSFAREDRSG